MIRYYKTALIVVLVLVPLFARAQGYCVVTFSEKRQHTEKLFERPLEPLVGDYLWIIQTDSLKLESGRVTMYPFVLDPFDDYPEFGWYSFYWRDMIRYPSKKNEDRLYKIIKEHRTKIQEYSYTQIIGRKQKTNKTKVLVYVTPIVGVCNSVISSFDNRRVFYSKEFEYQDKLLPDSLLNTLQSFPFFMSPYKIELDDTGLLARERE